MKKVQTTAILVVCGMLPLIGAAQDKTQQSAAPQPSANSSISPPPAYTPRPKDAPPTRGHTRPARSYCRMEAQG